VGNRTDHSGSYGAGNRILSFSGHGFAADSDGNVRLDSLSGGTVKHYCWSAEGRLDSVTSGSDVVRYAYDVGGRLVRRGRSGSATRYFLWDGMELVAELDSSAGGVQRVAEYAYYPGIDQPLALITGSGTGTQRYYTQDNLGNVTGLITGGAIAQSILYGAWGANWVTSGTLGDTNRLRWKGLVWDGDVTQLYYMRNRWYDAQLGRFLSEDPLGLASGLNWYAFAGADPIGGSDPLGLDPCGHPGEPACKGGELPGIAVTAPACDWRCILAGGAFGGESGPPLGPQSPGLAWYVGRGSGAGREPRSTAGSTGAAGSQQTPSCNAEAAQVVAYAALDIVSLAGYAVGAGLAARGLVAIAEGGLTRALAGSVGLMGFQTAGRAGALRAVAAGGTALAGEGAAQVLGGASVIVATNRPRLTVPFEPSTFGAAALLVPGVATYRAVGAYRECKGGT
jgi:RHS repeat-associated protein